MTIPDAIIEKLQLRQTGEQVGASFNYNQRVFRSDIAGIDVTLIECDLNGLPAKDVVWLDHKSKRYGTVTVEFLQDQSIEVIKQFMQ